MSLKQSFIAIALMLTIIACSEEKKESSTREQPAQTPLNPNGDSELALLMRAMFDEAQQIKKQIDNNEPISLTLNHGEILTAHATQPDKVASDEYKAFAKSYLQTITNLQTTDSTLLAEEYEAMVGKCLACHQEICPGPIVKIKKLQQLSGN